MAKLTIDPIIYNMSTVATIKVTDPAVALAELAEVIGLGLIGSSAR